MRKIKFKFLPTDTSNLGSNTISELIQPVISRQKGDQYCFVDIPSDSEIINRVMDLASKKRDLNISTLLVIGIGGSDLGTLAIHQAINGKYYNLAGSVPKILFVDTVEPESISSIYQIVEADLRNKKNILINVVTKSGTTIETLAGFNLFVDLLQKYCESDYAKYIVATTDFGSKLWQISEKNKYSLLEIPKNLSGRFSVFSAVGLFPLSIIGIDIKKLIFGAETMNKDCLSSDITQNIAAQSALVLFNAFKKNILINDLFLFSDRLEALGKWYRQLVGESLGKSKNVDGDIQLVGVTPTVSVGPADLHSVVQLYLGGPRDKFTTFVYVDDLGQEVFVPKVRSLEAINSNIQGKSFNFLLKALSQSVEIAYKKGNRDFYSVILPTIDEFSIGQFMQFKMFEIVYLASLLEINPFDQPNVEMYKQELRLLLENS